MTGPRVTLDDLAHVLGGVVAGDQVLAPGPNHSEVDRSMSVRAREGWPGFVVYSHCGDSWQECQAYVIDCLGFTPEELAQSQEQRAATTAERIARARAIWHEGRDPRGTVVESYLASRMLTLPDWAANRVIRFHPACPWKDDETGVSLQVPAMLCGMGNLESRELTAVHRTRLSPAGGKLGRKMLGVARDTAIPIGNLGESPHLVIGEGIETCLAASLMGFQPVWALGSASAIRLFPLLYGITHLTVLGENDLTSQMAVEACRARWAAAGRGVSVMLPNFGSDFNDDLMALSRLGRRANG